MALTAAKRMLGTAVALLVALGAGWTWGAYGRTAIGRALANEELRSSLLGARGSAMDARLDVYSVNFGEASRHLEVARSQLHTADTQLRALGRDEDATRLNVAGERIDEAQRKAGLLSQDANSLAAAAAQVIDSVLRGGTTP